MISRHLTDALTAIAARSFPRSRRADGLVVRDCAREAVDASGARVLARECLSLAGAGLRARAGVAGSELAHAPWRAALSVLTLPLAAAILALWIFGFVPRYDHWPLGEGWAMLLGGSTLAVVGVALRWRRLAAIGALATFAAAASPHLGMGTDAALANTPSFFQGDGVDLGAASLLPTLLLVAGALSLPRTPPRPIRTVLARLALGLAPATVALVYLLPAPEPTPTLVLELRGSSLEPIGSVGPPYPFPWIGPSQTLLAALGVALLAAVVVTWTRARARPADALASGLVLLSVAYPLVWASLPYLRVPYWAYQARYVWLLTILPLLLVLTLARRAGRTQHR